MDLLALANQISNKTANPKPAGVPAGVPAGMVAKPIITGITAVMELVPEAPRERNYPEELASVQRDLELQCMHCGRLKAQVEALKVSNADLERRLQEAQHVILRYQEHTMKPGNTHPRQAVADYVADGLGEERQLVATDAIGLRFNGPQGLGTADKIKACGGRWTWTNAKAKKGHWTIPNTPEAHAMYQELLISGKACETFAL